MRKLLTDTCQPDAPCRTAGAGYLVADELIFVANGGQPEIDKMAGMAQFVDSLVRSASGPATRGYPPFDRGDRHRPGIFISLICADDQTAVAGAARILSLVEMRDHRGAFG